MIVPSRACPPRLPPTQPSPQGEGSVPQWPLPPGGGLIPRSRYDSAGQTSRRSRSRRGVTIIEVIVLMTGVAAMLGLAVILLQLLMKLDADSRSRFDAAASLARLARQFRHDVHAAGSARLVEQPASKAAVLTIDSGPDRAIEYRVKGEDRIIRVETGKGTEVRRESFLVPRSGSIRLSIDEEDGRKFAALTVDRVAAKNRTDPPRRYEILALVGKNRDQVAGAAKAAGGKP